MPIRVGETIALNRGIVSILVAAQSKVPTDSMLAVRVVVSGKDVQPTGTVTLYDDNRALAGATRPLVDGAVTYSLAFAKPGMHHLSAKYSGDNNYSSQTNSNIQGVEVRGI